MSSCCGQNTPQFPSTITVNNTTVEIDGDAISHICEQVDFGGSTDGSVTYTPKTGMPVAVFLNGALQRETSEWTRSGADFTLTWTPRAEDIFVICYWYDPNAALPA